MKYAADNGIVDNTAFTADTYDSAITRCQMAMLFAHALPESEYSKINDISSAPEQTDDENVIKLYEAGILLGDDTGFRLDDTITRTEAAAIINRCMDF